MSSLNFCPKCGDPISTRHDGERERQACVAVGCGFIHFGEFSIGCAGVVTREIDGVTKALLVQRGHNPFAGMWQIPGGYAEHDELLSTAVEREVHEESKVIASVQDVLAFRHSLGGSRGGPATNIYVIFRLNYESGEPAFDGDEISNAGFYSLEEMEHIEGVQGLSKWGIQQALQNEPGTGLSIGAIDERSKAGDWQLFGLSF
jgi:ADP-ribose pyrophosphatase YjhB (NUDIX family)